MLFMNIDSICLVSQAEGIVNSMEQTTRVFCQTDVQEFHLWRWIFLKTYEVKQTRTFCVPLIWFNSGLLPCH